ncbi:MAG: protein kinase [Myxococcota bacterium]|nr:protein kinase [Myxococcota bacterium]
MQFALPNRYRHLEKIGDGANASVFSAYDTLKKHKVALKVSDPRLSAFRKFRFRWTQEVALLRRMAGPHVVPIYDNDQNDSQMYMVLGLASENFTDAISKPQTLGTVLTWLDQVLLVLSKMHLYRILHQDLKPENLLLHNKKIWVTDFSVARSLSLLNIDPKEISGTMGWQSPEQQKRKHKHVGPWSDLYSWGKILHYCVQNSASFSVLEPLIAKVTTGQYHQRASSAVFIRQWLCALTENWSAEFLSETVTASKSIPKAPSSVLDSVVEPLLLKDPISFSSPYVQRQKEIWAFACRAHESRRPKMLSIVGAKALGKSYLAKEIATGLYTSGRMKFTHIRYPKYGGFVQGIRDLLSPQEENAQSLIQRIEEQFLQQRSIHPERRRREATALALWSHFNQTVEVQIGLLFLLQQLRDEGGHCLLLEQPQRSQLSGDGLDLCLSILSQSFGSFPILILAIMDEEEVAEGTLAAQKIAHLAKLGAERVDLRPLSESSLASHLQSLSIDNPTQWTKIVQGRSGRLHTLLGHPYSIRWRDTWRETLIDTLVTDQTEAAVEFLIVLSISPVALPRYALVEHAEELDSLLTENVLKERGRWIYFLCKEVQMYFREQAMQRHYLALANVWTLAKHEDVHIRNLAWAEALIQAGDEVTPLPLLLKSIQQALDFGRTDVAFWGTQIAIRVKKQPSFSNESHLLFFQVLLAQRQYEELDTRIRRFLEEQTISAEGLAKVRRIQIAAALNQQQPTLAMTLHDFLHEEHEHTELLWLRGRYHWTRGELAHAKQNFETVMQSSSPKESLWGDSFRKYLECCFENPSRRDLREPVRQFLFQAKQLASISNVAQSSLSKGQWTLIHGNQMSAIQSFQLAAAISLLSGNVELWWRASCFRVTISLWNYQLSKAREIVDRMMWQAKSLRSAHHIRLARAQHVSTFCIDPQRLQAKVGQLQTATLSKDETLYLQILHFLSGEPIDPSSIDWGACRDPAMILSMVVAQQRMPHNSLLEKSIDRLILYCSRDEIQLFEFLRETSRKER